MSECVLRIRWVDDELEVHRTELGDNMGRPQYRSRHRCKPEELGTLVERLMERRSPRIRPFTDVQVYAPQDINLRALQEILP